jgi:2,3-bisphosphoglycerate-dependent phosphoglycerate mutase
VRHGQSDWNLKNLFAGWKDPDLTGKDLREAKDVGRRLKALSLRFDTGFTSELIRARNTVQLIVGELGQEALPVARSEALNERDYGDLFGLNKDEARRKWGEEQVHIWRRPYDIRPLCRLKADSTVESKQVLEA